MANIIRRHEPAELAPRPVSRGRFWDPFETMRELLRWDPFQEMGMMPSLVERPFVPAFDVRETGDSYLFKADLPGLRDEDLEISITGNRVTVSGKRAEEETREGETYYCYERASGNFSRSFTLPEGADTDNVKAELRDGVLNMIIAKKPEVQPKKISLKSGKEKAKA